jgi:hypothetical protein
LRCVVFQDQHRVSIDLLRSVFKKALPETTEQEEKEAFASLLTQHPGGFVDRPAFKAFATKDPRYLRLFRATLGMASPPATPPPQ